MLAEGDIKSTIVLGLITLQLVYENLNEMLPNRNNSSNKLEQKVLDR